MSDPRAMLQSIGRLPKERLMDVTESLGSKPHDALFKALFEQRDIAEELLGEWLSPRDAAILRLATARRIEGDLTDNHLNQRLVDVLFEVDTVPLSVPEVAIIVFEQKSWPDREVVWQLFESIYRIFERWRRQHGPSVPLPRIIAIIIYTGRKPWNVPRSFREMGGPKSSSPSLVDFRYTLVNLGARSKRKMPKAPAARVVTLALKYAYLPPEEQAAALAPVFEALLRIPKLFTIIFNYIVGTSYELKYTDVMKVALEYFSEEEPMLRSAVDRLRDEARNEGRVEGRNEGRLEGRNEGRLEGRNEGLREGAMRTLMRQLAQRFGAVPTTAEQRIRQAEKAQLETWLDRVLDATSVEAVLAG